MKVISLSILFFLSSLAMQNSAKAETASDFDPGVFYKITNNSVGGQELALTFILPTGDDLNPGAMTNYMTKSFVLLEKYKKDEPRQLWQFNAQGNEDGHGKFYWIYNKYSDSEKQLTGTLRVINTDNQFSEGREYQKKYNRTTVGPAWNEFEGFWVISKVAGGKWRIMSLKGVHIKKPKEKPYPSTWNESRSLEAYKPASGPVEVRQGKTANIPTQFWTITKVP